MAKIYYFQKKNNGGVSMAPAVATARQRAEEFAQQILDKYDIQSIPINPVIIARILGVEVRDVEFTEPNISGMISKKDGKSNVFVKHNDTIPRKRFTIAHELGHHVMHLSNSQSDGGFMDRHFRMEYIEGQPFSVQEVEANQFAAALLMPKEQVFRRWPDHEYDWEFYGSVYGIANEFGVSEPAMKARLEYLELIK